MTDHVQEPEPQSCRSATGLRLWLWTYTDPITGRRRQTTWRMTEEDARKTYGEDAQRVDWSLEIRTPLGQTSDFLRR